MTRSRYRKAPRWRLAVEAGLLLVAAGGAAWFGFAGGTAMADPAISTAAAAQESALASDQAPGSLPQGALPTRVVLERAGIDAPISEVGVVNDGARAVWETAWRAAGHHIGSARPGQPGNMVLTGHVSVADRRNIAVFATLGRAQKGDIVEVYAGDQVYRYAVSRVGVVQPSAVSVLRSDHTATVTLITCTPDLKSRVIVVGTLI